MARLHDIVVNCRRPASLARFWAAALDGYNVAPYDDAEIARLREMGVDDVEDDPTVLVEASGGGPRLFFQRVDETKVAKNRLHLDLRCDDVDADVKRLTTLGATVERDRRVDGVDWIVMNDPEGNEFCISG